MRSMTPLVWSFSNADRSPETMRSALASEPSEMTPRTSISAVWGSSVSESIHLPGKYSSSKTTR